MDYKCAILVITLCCVLYNICHMNHDIGCIDVAGMQDPHPNVNVNKGILTSILNI